MIKVKIVSKHDFDIDEFVKLWRVRKYIKYILEVLLNHRRIFGFICGGFNIFFLFVSGNKYF
jgi:hypothetical protein